MTHESGGAARGQGKQTQLGSFMGSSPGGCTHFSCNVDRLVEDFATYITLDELPFPTGDSPNLEHMIGNSLQPTYRRILRDILKRPTQK